MVPRVQSWFADIRDSLLYVLIFVVVTCMAGLYKLSWSNVDSWEIWGINA